MRARNFSIIVVVCFGVLFLGLVNLQLVNHHRYRMLAEGNRLRVVPLIAPRGKILDRSGEVLAEDVLVFNVSVVYERIRDLKATSDLLKRILHLSDDDVAARLEAARQASYLPSVIASDISMAQAIALKELSGDFPGVSIEPSSRREYPHGSVAAHILGYMGMIGREEFDILRMHGYLRNDLLGRSGIERTYEEYLRGQHGGKQMEVDNRGRVSEVLGYRHPRKGKDISLTIDLGLQKFCEGILEGKKGSIIAMDPYTGAVLAMAVSPGFSPSVFLGDGGPGEVQRLLRDEDSPLLNRAISGEYPPGSVFKLAVAAAGLSSGDSTPQTKFDCRGSFTLGRTVFRCWFARGHGEQGLCESIQTSCNVYFYELSLLTGVENISRYAGLLGTGRRTGIDLPAERPGILPSPSWKRKRLGEPWYRGDTVNLSIGQGYLTVTPIQMARMAGVFASEGRLVRPYLVRSIAGIDAFMEDVRDTGIPVEHLAPIREGMQMAVNTRRGTGMRARSRDLVISGKTGTAQTPRGENHGWFVGFAPFERPDMVIVVFDEHGGRGGYYAAETAGEVFREAHRIGLLKSITDTAEDG